MMLTENIMEGYLSKKSIHVSDLFLHVNYLFLRVRDISIDVNYLFL